MVTSRKNGSSGRRWGFRLAARARSGAGALLAAGMMACGAVLTAPAWAGPDQSVQEMTRRRHG
jgi:hypothetical protein